MTTAQTIINAMQHSTSIEPITLKSLIDATGIAESIINDHLEALYTHKVINRCYVQNAQHQGYVYWRIGSATPKHDYSNFTISNKPNQNLHKRAPNKLTTGNQDTTVKNTTSKADLIRKAITTSPGITHDDLINRVTNYSIDEIEIKKTADLITYVIKQGGFEIQKSTEISRGHTIKQYYETKYLNSYTVIGGDTAKDSEPAIIKEQLPPKPLDSGKLEPTQPSALKIQEGGNHYKDMAIQPVQYIMANNLDFLSGNVIKYISRHEHKNGKEDILKAIHYCNLILEFTYNEN